MPTHRQRTAAWMVHLYTMSGGIIGIYALILATEGKVRYTFLLLILTMFIDSTDGILARRARVKQVLPHFDGAMIDNVIDVLTYVWIPVFIMVSEKLIPHTAWIIMPVVAAMYAYGQVNMKSEDAFFLGFPSYWNVVALYLFWHNPAPTIAVIMLIIPGILTFIPTRYLYPSRNQVLWKTSWGLGAVWFIMVIYLLFQKTPSETLIFLTWFYPVYYLIASFYVDWRIRHSKIKVTVIE